MTTLAEFLLARIAEDEQRARICAQIYPPPWDLSDRGWVAYVKADEPDFREVVRLEQYDAARAPQAWLGDTLEHIARWDPARVLAECEAKRQVIDAYRGLWEVAKVTARAGRDEEANVARNMYAGVELAMQALALPYADHPDFREEWRP